MIELKYGTGKIKIAIPAKAEASILEPLKAPVLASVKAALEEALHAPLGSLALEAIIAQRRPRSVAIAFPDETRPAPLGDVLPPLLDRLEAKLERPLAETVTLFIGGGLALNYVLDADKRVVHLAAGAPASVLASCAEVCAKVCGVAIAERFDIVLASCGGHPKDICLYQAQKGLNLASQALKPGGRILLLAASPQGVRDDIYFDYVSQFASPEEVIRDFKSSGFRMGAHKAYLFGRTLVNFDVAVFSDLDPGILGKCHLRAADPAAVLDEWVASSEGTLKVAIIRNANTTYFYKKEG